MSYQKLSDDIVNIEGTPQPYGALRIVIASFNIIGWAVIVIHFLVTVVLAYPFIRGKLPNDALVVLLLTLVFLLIGFLVGISIIASGQVLELLLDMRNDIHITRRYVRRFGLFMAKTTEQKTE